MKSCGIVAEYNPFHTGHRYHLQEARRQSEAEVIVVVMSGNFVQRGEPAIFDKWIRAQQALQNGADLIIALPVLSSVQAADYFAAGSIALLQRAQCDAISFGSEVADVNTLQRGLDQWQRCEREIHRLIKEDASLQSVAYPVQVATCVERYFSSHHELQLLLQHPNHQLAFAYLKAMAQYNWHPELYPITRFATNHHDRMIHQDHFASGTALRNAILNRQKLPTITDERLYHLLVDRQQTLLQEPTMEWERFWPLLQYRLVISTTAQLQAIYQVTDGIEQRLKQAALSATSFLSFIEQVKTRSWTRTRLQRICLYILLNVTQQQLAKHWQPSSQPAQVLGFTSRGRAYLKQLHQLAPQSFLTNYAASKDWLQMDYRFDELYAIKQVQPYRDQNIARIPLQVNEKVK